MDAGSLIILTKQISSQTWIAPTILDEKLIKSGAVCRKNVDLRDV